MNQTIVCKVKQCGFCSSSGFCLSKLTVINENGVCKYLTRPDWKSPVEDRWKNIYKEPRQPVEKLEVEEKEGENEQES